MNHLEFGEDFKYENINKSVKENIIKSYKEYDIMKAKKYSKDQLEDLVDEHKNLVDVMSSESKEDDKKEVKDQKKELEGYEKDLEKAFEVLEKSINHKYFKREGSAGNYKYYYTEADYKAGKSSSSEPKEESKIKVPEGDIARHALAEKLTGQRFSGGSRPFQGEEGAKKMQNIMDWHKESQSTLDKLKDKVSNDKNIDDWDFQNDKDYKSLTPKHKEELIDHADKVGKEKFSNTKDSDKESHRIKEGVPASFDHPTHGKLHYSHSTASDRFHYKTDKEHQAGIKETKDGPSFDKKELKKLEDDNVVNSEKYKKYYHEHLDGDKTPSANTKQLAHRYALQEARKDIKKSEDSEIEKAFELLEKGGEGSKGGKIIGHTKSGKPIYDSANHTSHKKLTHEEHREAADLHDEIKYKVKGQAAVNEHESQAKKHRTIAREMKDGKVEEKPSKGTITSKHGSKMNLDEEPEHKTSLKHAKDNMGHYGK